MAPRKGSTSSNRFWPRKRARVSRCADGEKEQYSGGQAGTVRKVGGHQSEDRTEGRGQPLYLAKWTHVHLSESSGFVGAAAARGGTRQVSEEVQDCAV